MVHSAYDSFELLTGCPSKIESVESYGSKILLGCADGSLLVYAPESTRSATVPEMRKESYALETNLKGFAKKAVVSMQVAESRELLLSLSESIAFHKLSTFEIIAVITKAKGANAFCWDEHRGFLCFARQKRVCIFRHDGGRGFVEVKDFGVPDVVKSMSWCGDNICLGIRKEYVILNATSGAISEVFTSGRLAPPLVVSLPSGELLLGKENIGVIVDQNGKLRPEGRICWSEAPTEVVIQKPYALALLPRFVEIRSLRAPYPLIQTVVFRNVRHLRQSNNSVIIALENSVHGLFPVPLGAQIVQLTAAGNFEEALSLCKLLPPEESNLRAAKEGSIHIRYAHYLFDNGSYEESMEHFLASQVDITHVLSLYSSIILPKTTIVHEADKLDFGDDLHLSRGSSPVSDDMEPSTASNMSELDDSAELESKKMSHNMLMALIKFLQKKRHSIIEKATAEGTEEVVFDAVGNNFESYNSSRFKKINKGRGSIPVSSGAREMASVLDTALLQALLLTGQPSMAENLLRGLNYCDLKICEEILQEGSYHVALVELYKCNSKHREALELINKLAKESKASQSNIAHRFKPEAIIEYLKPLCVTDPTLVLEYSMLVLESCPTQTIELFLSGNIPADMVNLYLKQNAPNLQSTYLELVLAMNEDAVSGTLQNEMVQIYLSEVLDWHGDLSSQQQWDEKVYSLKRKKLLSALESISGYNPETLLKLLPSDALYEERAILLGKMNQHELALSLYVHKLHVPELALSYCDHVYESTHKASGKSTSNIYLMLLQIYLNPRTTTKNYENKISKILSPRSKSLRKVRSRSFSKSRSLGSKKIAAIEIAEDTKASQSSDSGRSDVETDEFIEEGDISIMLDEALDLLSRRWDRINGAQALKLLPKETKLQNLLPFLGPLVRKSSEMYRNCSVVRSLRQSENLQVKDELYNKRKAVMKISGDNMCSLCNKKIGTSVFAVYPNGKTLVHFVCFRDSQSMKAVAQGTPFKKPF
ncbi:vacuolar sorting protein 39 isoform X1 [Lathyrus oleraceus]|uniref:Vam6/Vps39-like protein n=1 Tax=Pisum sativum TaxID=3888 RepID=A0A9D4XFJ7_PEA|nr:vacuolar sorting protein 39-like isoform X1 [Pisum sativum]KAI5418335.1 Vam6/Vps39-like protein [Pisum sativum]